MFVHHFLPPGQVKKNRRRSEIKKKKDKNKVNDTLIRTNNRKKEGKHLALMATVLMMQRHFYFLCMFVCESVWVLLRVLSGETDLDVSRMVSREICESFLYAHASTRARACVCNWRIRKERRLNAAKDGEMDNRYMEDIKRTFTALENRGRNKKGDEWAENRGWDAMYMGKESKKGTGNITNDWKWVPRCLKGDEDLWPCKRIWALEIRLERSNLLCSFLPGGQMPLLAQNFYCFRLAWRQ